MKLRETEWAVSPQDKAKQFINKFLHIKVLKLSDYSVIEYPTAKECALITVNDILDNIEAIMDVHTDNNILSIKNYYDQVKQELDNL